MTKAQPDMAPDVDAESVCRIIVKARQFDAKEGVVEEDYGANSADEQFREVLADSAEDPVYDELKTFIDDMDIDQQCDLVALMWVGRGDFESADWAQAVALAHQEHTRRTAEYLLGSPLLADHLAEGLSQFGYSCEGFEKDHL